MVLTKSVLIGAYTCEIQEARFVMIKATQRPVRSLPTVADLSSGETLNMEHSNDIEFRMSDTEGRKAGWIDSLSRHWTRPEEVVAPEMPQVDLMGILERMAARMRVEPSLDDLLSALAEEVGMAVFSEITIVRVYDSREQSLVIRGVGGLPPYQARTLLGMVSPTTEAFRGLRPGSLVTFTPDRPLVLQHASALIPAEVQIMKELGAGQILVLPLHHRGKLLGRLDLLRVRHEPFSVDDGVIANVLASLVAGVIDGPLQEADEQRQSSIIQASFAFQHSIEPVADVGEMLQHVVEAVRRIISCDRCYGLLWKESREEFVPAAVSGVNPDLVDTLKQITLTPQAIPALALVLQRDESVRIDESNRAQLLPDWFAHRLGTHSAVLVPLRSRDNALIAVLMLDCTSRSCHIGDRELAILSMIGPYATTMVENALLYQEVKEGSDRLLLVNDIGIELASLTDIPSLVRQVHLHVGAILDASRFCIGLILPDGASVEYRYAVEDELHQEPVQLPLGDDPLSRVMRERDSVLINNGDTFDPIPWFPFGTGRIPSESILAVPITIGREAVGVISVQSEARGAYTDHDLQLLSTVGMQTGVAIENARLYQIVHERGERRGYLLDKVLHRQEAERKNIADDIHNDTLQTLASCLYRIDFASRRASHISPDETQEELRSIRDNLSDNIDRLRHIIFQIRPSTLDILGLEPALREHLKYAGQGTAFDARLDIDIDARLSSEMETAIYRIAQEALDNARIRPGMSRIVIRIRQHGQAILMTVADDGEHLTGDERAIADATDLPALDAATRLLTLKERVELAGGTVQTTERPGRGSSLQVVLPYRSES